MKDAHVVERQEIFVLHDAVMLFSSCKDSPATVKTLSSISFPVRPDLVVQVVHVVHVKVHVL